MTSATVPLRKECLRRILAGAFFRRRGNCWAHLALWSLWLSHISFLQERHFGLIPAHSLQPSSSDWWRWPWSLTLFCSLRCKVAVDGHGQKDTFVMNRLLFAPTLIAVAIIFASPSDATADDLLAGLPTIPNSTTIGTGDALPEGQMARYSTAAAPGAVIASYKQALSASGWTITGGGGGSSGGGFQATSGSKYLSFNAGGPQGTTYVSVCVWPTKPQDDHCGDNN